MTEDAIEHLARSEGVPRRHALLTLGVGGLAAALTGSQATSAKSGSGQKGKKGRKRKKRCRKQQQSCVDRVRTHCAGWGGDAPFCEQEFLPCCDSCDVGAGVTCALEGFSLLG